MIKHWSNKGLLPIWLGFLIWLISIFNWWPYSIFSLNHVQILILSAPLLLIPLSLKKENEPQTLIWGNVVIALFIVVSFYFEEGFAAAFLVIPWLLFCIILLFRGFKQADWKSPMQMKTIVKLISFIYLLIGAIWLIADRLDFQPLGFDPTIVLLTVAHFHFAGYMLLIITSWICDKDPSKFINWTSWLVAIGVPMVAIGITATQLGFSQWIETFSVIIMASGGGIIGLKHIIIIGWKGRSKSYGKLWMIGGFALMMGMVLAFLYGIREILYIPFLTIPWMYAVHGTLNAIGFALPVVLGWFLYRES